MGITAGVMISLSFLELVNKAWALQGFWTVTLGFSAGAMLMIWHQHYTAIGIILGAIFVFILSGIFGV